MLLTVLLLNIFFHLVKDVILKYIFIFSFTFKRVSVWPAQVALSPTFLLVKRGKNLSWAFLPCTASSDCNAIFASPPSYHFFAYPPSLCLLRNVWTHMQVLEEAFLTSPTLSQVLLLLPLLFFLTTLLKCFGAYLYLPSVYLVPSRVPTYSIVSAG